MTRHTYMPASESDRRHDPARCWNLWGGFMLGDEEVWINYATHPDNAELSASVRHLPPGTTAAVTWGMYLPTALPEARP